MRLYEGVLPKLYNVKVVPPIIIRYVIRYSLFVSVPDLMVYNDAFKHICASRESLNEYVRYVKRSMHCAMYLGALTRAWIDTFNELPSDELRYDETLRPLSANIHISERDVQRLQFGPKLFDYHGFDFGVFIERAEYNKDVRQAIAKHILEPFPEYVREYLHGCDTTVKQHCLCAPTNSHIVRRTDGKITIERYYVMRTMCSSFSNYTYFALIVIHIWKKYKPSFVNIVDFIEIGELFASIDNKDASSFRIMIHRLFKPPLCTEMLDAIPLNRMIDAALQLEVSFIMTTRKEKWRKYLRQTSNVKLIEFLRECSKYSPTTASFCKGRLN